MFDWSMVPYFPLKLTPEGSDYAFYNPAADTDSRVSQAAGRVLQLCDGERTWDEIVAQLSQASGTSVSTVVRHVRPFLRRLTTEGAVWWRRQRMTWSVPTPPTSVFWNITGKCNLSCRHCAVHSGIERPGGPSLAACRRVIDDMAAFGIRDVTLSGGEPLIRPDWFQIAVYARSRGLTVSVSTNGTLVTEAAARKMTALVSDVQVSIDGATPEVHDTFRRAPGSWRRAVRGVQNFVAAGVPVTIGTTVTRANVHQIPMLCDLTRDLGAPAFRILPFIPFGRGRHWRKLEVSPGAMRRVTEVLRQRRQQKDIQITEMEFECTFDPPPLRPAEPQGTIGCGGARSYVTITESGEVLPCHFFQGVEAENVLHHDLAWIWEHSRFLNYFRSLTVADLTGACPRCDWLAACLGSCRAANFAHRRLLRGNCHCWLDKTNRRTPPRD